MFIEELEGAGTPNIERTLRQGFQTWFRNHVSCNLDLFRLYFWATESDMCVLHWAGATVAEYESRRG
jgi:hypothetical protein